MGRFVYYFGDGRAEGSIDKKQILGGKGAGLHEMTNLGIPVPPGFTITAEVCAHFEREGRYPEGLEAEIEVALARLERSVQKRLGDEQNPLLVSVRSGAAASMPGMMDTVLNLGLNDRTRAGLAARTGNERFAWDAYRRFIAMFGSIVRRVPRERFEAALEEAKAARGAQADTELSAADLERLVARLKAIFEEATGEPFPDDPREQLRQAIAAVFKSWQNERARTYRRIHRIEGLLGTAVNVQAMVFGNTGERSATGVCFTRDPATGENRLYGEFLVNAQGEDVVAGIRTPRPISELETLMPSAYARLLETKERLERHLRDMQDIEFTIEDGALYLLQTRTGKRTGPAAVRIAVEMVEERMIDEEAALLRVEPEHLEQLLFPIFEPRAKERAIKEGRLLAKGLPAGPGAAAGRVVFHARDAEVWAKRGERVLLVRHETSPEDIGGMVAAQGILTATGGATSHAAVVGRGMGKTCVVGCGALKLDYERREIRVKDRTIAEGGWLSIDGSTGEVIEGELTTMPSEIVQVLSGKLSAEKSGAFARFSRLLGWADRARRLGVRANADTPEDAATAVAFGAEGIGLARTEHMFFGPGRIPAVREMIFAETAEARARALAKIAPMQRDDFAGIFRAMGGRPVTIRLLDPPLHEFLPQEPEQVEELARHLGLDARAVAERARSLREMNPMLGHRGCRLGLTYPEIYDMQVRAIVEAACAVLDEGIEVRPEVMIPLVGVAKELEILRARAERVTAEVLAGRGERRPQILFGTMIEIPRACLTAAEIAPWADFFSFGTNDLTQCTYGYSRDDAGTFLPVYEELGILKRDPFAALDRAGVGRLMRIAVEEGRAARPGLKVGVCGEHGGEPTSIAFCHDIGLDYVSCSPYRVPIARLAAAHAALAERGRQVASAH